MNIKSELHKLLEYKPIINPNTKDIFFDPYEKNDVKIMKKYSINHFWTWLNDTEECDNCSHNYIWGWREGNHPIKLEPFIEDIEYIYLQRLLITWPQKHQVERSAHEESES